MRRWVPVLLIAAAVSAKDREVSVGTDEELRRALAEAVPGTRILVAPGEYRGFSAAAVAGKEGRPIVLTAATPEDPPRFCGGIHFSDVGHFEIRGITIRGAPANGLNIDDGGSFDTPSHHLLLAGVTVLDCGGRGNDDGIKLSGVVDFRLEGCTVERWGRGGSAVDMVGCHRGTIEGCTFRDREVGSAATGVQAKGGSRDVTIRLCRFEHAGERAVNLGGSTGLAYFRPKPEGFEAKDLTVEGCTFVGSMAPVAFVGVDGATVRWNTFYRPRKWLLRILQETREPGFLPCRRGIFADNLVAYRASEIATPVNAGPGVAAETFSFARNYWYCLDDPSRGAVALPVRETSPGGGRDPQFRDPEKGDLRVAAASPAKSHGAHALPADARR